MANPTPTSPPREGDDSSLLDALIPVGFQKFVMGLPGINSLKTASEERRDLVGIILFAAAIFIPYLGSVGLWDPWEPHYGEVAREMIWRHDYVYPWWFTACFFSKPPLLMWLMSIGMNLVGVGSTPENEPLPMFVEWAMRLPVAILAIAGVVVLCLALHRIYGRRMAFLTAFVLVTCPFYYFLARQCMEDMPLVACLEIAIGSFLIAEFTTLPGTSGDATQKRAHPGWWYSMYAFAAFATLAKESLGIAIPGLVIFVYLVLSGDWNLLKRARLLPGAILFLAICAPWYATLIRFNGHDDEWHTFAYRLVWDNILRLKGEVHTTTPGWTFTYFIEQLGWGLFPWTVLIPGAIVAMGKLSRLDPRPPARAALVMGGWAISVFILFTLSGTKFHHYVFPALPALAFCIAYFIDQFWKDGLDVWTVPSLAAVGLLAAVGSNLYVWHEDNGQKHSGLKHFTDLFVYQYNRPYPYNLDDPDLFAKLVMGGGVALVAALIWQSKRFTAAAFAGFALVMALWGSWFYWRAMSPAWSQRDEFWAVYKERQHNEPITGFILGEGWRGETFYGRNTIRQINDAPHLLQFVGQEGPKFVIVEQARYNNLRQALGTAYQMRIVDQSSTKFYLVEITS